MPHQTGKRIYHHLQKCRLEREGIWWFVPSWVKSQWKKHIKCRRWSFSSNKFDLVPTWRQRIAVKERGPCWSHGKKAGKKLHAQFWKPFSEGLMTQLTHTFFIGLWHDFLPSVRKVHKLDKKTLMAFFPGKKGGTPKNSPYSHGNQRGSNLPGGSSPQEIRLYIVAVSKAVFLWGAGIWGLGCGMSRDEHSFLQY